MATHKTYTVGLNGTVWRMTNHNPNTWTDISLGSSNLIGTGNILEPNTATGSIFPFSDFSGYHLVDVMTDPDDYDKLCVIAGNDPKLLPNTQLDYFNEAKAGIFMSHNAGATWFVPGGDWYEVCQRKNDSAPDVNFHFEVWYADSDTIYIISEGGHIFRSIDGGLTFNTVKNNANNPRRAGSAYQFTSCIHMWKDTTGINGGLDYGVIAQIADINNAGSNVEVWKTLDGGVTWTALNSGNPLTNTITGINSVGNATGIYMSQDQSMITVQTEYIVNRSTDSGATFNTTSEILRNGLHLTWYEPYDPFVADFWVSKKGVGSLSLQSSNDAALTWTNVLNNGSRTDGAHFYSEINGYLTAGINLVSFITTNPNIVQPSLQVTEGNDLLAVWTTTIETTFELTDCDGEAASIFVQVSDGGTPLLPYTNLGGITWGPGGLGIGNNNTVQPAISIIGSPDIDENICWTVSLASPPPTAQIIIIGAVTVEEETLGCEACLTDPPTPTDCWRLEVCPFSTGTCLTIENHTGYNWTPWENQWVYINNDTTCIYRPVRILQAIYISPDSYSDLCALPTPWANDVIYEITSLEFNSTQYITTPVASYTMTDVNYDPVECSSLVCTSVACGTTENSYANISDYINTVLVSLGLDSDLQALPNDTANAPGITYSDTTFKMQYASGSTFQIIVKKDIGGVITYYGYNLLPGNTGGVIAGSSITSATKYIPNAFEVQTSLCSDTTLVPAVTSVVDAVCEEIPSCDINASVASTNITVNGGSDGTITVTPIDNFGAVTYLWNTGDTTSSLTGLAPGVYTVTVTDTGIGDDCFVTLQIILTEPPPPPAPPETCEVTPRLGEPGFSAKNCDPKTLIKIKNQYADSVYALFKRMRYGIETCCEFDLDKIDIKHQLLELGEMNDPDACFYECNRYLISGIDDGIANFTYKDCFGATLTNSVEIGREARTVLVCARPDTFVSLDNPINVEFIEKCCDAEPTINMIRYCITLSEANVSAVITWLDYAGIERTKTLTNIEGSCGPEGVDTLYICAQEGSVDTTTPDFVTITEKGTC